MVYSMGRGLIEHKRHCLNTCWKTFKEFVLNCFEHGVCTSCDLLHACMVCFKDLVYNLEF